MTYEEIVKEVRKTFEHADARRVFEHVAIEIDIVGEGAGAMYFEIANRACVIEPYNYYDHDGVITGPGDIILKLGRKELRLADAIKQGLVTYEGDVRKLQLCVDNVRLPGIKYD